jgi:hypothetical protein
MKLSDLACGDYVTCIVPVGVYSPSRAFFTPSHIGTIATIDPRLPAEVIVDFYCRNLPYESPVRAGQAWRCCLRRKNVKKVSQDEAFRYLKLHAPTWQEHLQDLLESYGDGYFELVRKGRCEPYAMYPAHAVLVPFLQTGPLQQDLLAFLEGYQKEFEYTGKRVMSEASTLVLTNRYLHEGRIPWTYVTGYAELPLQGTLPGLTPHS